MKPFSIQFAILLCLVVVSCGKSAKEYTLEEINELGLSTHTRLWDEIVGEDAELLRLGKAAAAKDGDPKKANQTTIGDLIERGRKMKEAQNKAAK